MTTKELQQANGRRPRKTALVAQELISEMARSSAVTKAMNAVGSNIRQAKAIRSGISVKQANAFHIRAGISVSQAHSKLSRTKAFDRPNPEFWRTKRSRPAPLDVEAHQNSSPTTAEDQYEQYSASSSEIIPPSEESADS